MARAVFDEMKNAVPKNHFTVGIHDDVTPSLAYDPEFSTEIRERSAPFSMVSSDGTVGANKN